MRIPGGDAVQRVYAIHATSESPFGQPFLIVEFENQSAVPFALAFAVVPFHPLGRGRIDSVRLDGATLLVNGAPGGAAAHGHRPGPRPQPAMSPPRCSAGRSTGRSTSWRRPTATGRPR